MNFSWIQFKQFHFLSNDNTAKYRKFRISFFQHKFACLFVFKPPEKCTQNSHPLCIRRIYAYDNQHFLVTNTHTHKNSKYFSMENGKKMWLKMLGNVEVNLTSQTNGIYTNFHLLQTENKHTLTHSRANSVIFVAEFLFIFTFVMCFFYIYLNAIIIVICMHRFVCFFPHNNTERVPSYKLVRH